MESRTLLSATVTRFGDIGYFASSSGPQIQRYDTVNETWLSPITLSGATQAPSVIHVDNDGLYVAYGKSVYRYQLDGTSPTHLINAQYNLIGIHSDGNVLFLNQSGGLYARFLSFNKTTNQLIDTIENYVDSVGGSSISTSANRIIGRSQGVSPSDITFVSYGDDGQFSGGGDSPYHGDYPGASMTWMFPGGTKVVDDSGTIYSASSLTRLNSFGSTITDVAFLGNDVPIVLSGNKITAYSSAILPSGSAQLSDSPTNIFVNQTHVITFKADATTTPGFRVGLVNLSSLNPPTPGQPINPVGLKYTPDKIETMADGKTLIYSQSHQSLFIWDPETQSYSQSIPLVDTADYMAYSAITNTAYLAYPSGLIRKLDLSAANPVEVPFATLPQAPLGLATAGKYLFAADGSGAWMSHYTFAPDGGLIEAVDWNYYSTEYIWSESNQKMYFFRDDTSPNDLLAEEINANGANYDGEPAGGIGGEFDSPLHDSYGFEHPIRVSPDGKTVVLGSGMIHDAETLERSDYALSDSIADAAWIGNELYTIRNIDGGAQIQKWQLPTFANTKSVRLQGVANRLLSLPNDRLLAITMGTDGVPAFTVFGQDIVSTDRTAPTLVSFARSDSAKRETNADQLYFRVSFNESVTDVDATDFAVNGQTTARITQVSEVEGSGGKEFELEITGGDLNYYNGPVSLNLRASQNITDFAGNPLPTVEPAIDEDFLLDDTLPQLYVSMVKDIVPGDSSSGTENLTVVGDLVFFTAYDIVHGAGLWRSDGTADGTFSIHTEQMDDYGGQPRGLVAVEKSVFFWLYNSLWKSDGTSSGTVMISDDFGDSLRNSSMQAIAAGGTLFFTMSHGYRGLELWKSDGTSEGTSLVTEMKFGTQRPILLGAVNENLYFVQGDAESGLELWKSVGTSSDTTLIKQISTDDLYQRWLVSGATVGNRMVFTVDDGVHGNELWVTDGTPNGTGLLHDIIAGDESSYVDSFTRLGDSVLFWVGQELWKTDGTSAGTSPIGSAGVSGIDVENISPMVVVNNMVYFVSSWDEGRAEISRSDGTVEGTRVFVEEAELPQDLYSIDLLALSGNLIVSISTYDGQTLLSSDGTTSDFSIITTDGFRAQFSDEDGQPKWVTTNDRLFFVLDNNISDGPGVGELHQFSTTPNLPTGTQLLADVVPGPDLDGYRYYKWLSYATELGTNTIFFERHSGSNTNLWITDGTTEGTSLLSEIDGEVYLENGSPVTTGGIAYFEAVSSEYINGSWISTNQMWRTDGTQAGTSVVFTAPADAHFSSSLFVLGESVIFNMYDEDGRLQLWKSSGQTNEVIPYFDLGVTNNDYALLFETKIANQVFFRFDDGIHGAELWATDGTTEGTRLVADIQEGEFGSNLRGLTSFNGTLFFTADDGIHGQELWMSDGTAEGTVLVIDVQPGPEGSFSYDGYPSAIAVVNDTLYFAATSDGNMQIWKSDGTSEGTSPIATDFLLSNIESLTASGNLLYFSASSDGYQRGLWKTDGTPEGTVMVYPFDPDTMIDVEGTLFFTTGELESGYGRSDIRLWRTDGTFDGTEAINTPFLGDYSANLSTSHGTLYYEGSDPEHGRELWIVSSQDTVAPTMKAIRRDGSPAEGTVCWTVEFSEKVRGVNVSDFELVGDHLSGASIVSVVGSGAHYTVQANVGSANGRLALKLADNDSIFDRWLNKLGGEGTTGDANGSVLGEAFVFDVVAPTVVSFSRNANQRTNAASVSWTLTFSEEVSGVDVTDFTLSQTGVASAAITSVTGSGTTYIVTASTGAGDGTLGIKLVDNDSIQDLVGLPLGAAGKTDPSNGSFLGNNYTLDKTLPTTVSFVRQAPVGSLTNADSLVFRVRFSESMSDVDATDFVVNGSTTGSVTNVSPVSGANGKQFDVTVSGGDLVSISGTVGLNFSTSASISDLAGNLVAKTEPVVDEAYVLDNLVPVVNSIDRVSDARNNLNSVSWTVVLSESVTGVDSTDFALVAAGVTGATITGVTGSGTTYVVTANSGLSDGTLGIKLVDDDSIRDAASNPLGGPGLTGANNGGFLGKVYTFDKTRPNALSFAIQAPSTNRTNADTLVFRTKFSETVNSVDASDFVVNGTTTATVTNVAEVSGSGGKQFDVTVSGGNLASFNGPVGLNLSGSPNIADAVGNLVMTSEPAIDDSYLLDNVAPVATSFVRLTPTETPTVATAFVFRATFSRAVVNLDPTDFVVTGGSTATVASVTTVIGSRATQFDVTVSGGNVASFNGAIGLNLSGTQDIRDQVGNPLPNTEPAIDESFSRLMLRDVTFTATGNAVLKADVVSGLLRVTINNVVDTQLNGVDLALIRSLTINGGSGNDSINLTGLLTGPYTRLTSVSLNGGDGNDTIVGSSFNEIISGGKGNDSLNGGVGTDRLVESASASFVLTNGKLTGNGNDSLANFEEASLTGGTGADTLNASAFTGNVTLIGGEGNDSLIGGSGNDSLDGGGNNDILTGNGGNDFLVGSAGGDMVVASGGTNYVATNTSLVGNGNDVLDHIEVLSLTTANTSSSIDVSAFVATAPNTLTGGNGDDTIIGSRGRDSITGGAGNDNLKGGEGDDSIMAGAGNDLVDGGAGNDSITGLTGVDTLAGGTGDDSIDGGAGDDAILGQDGNDLLVGGDGNDTIIGGIGNDTLKGGKNEDLLIGGFGDDSIDGEAGNDKAVGGQGKSGMPRNGNSQKDAGDSLTAEITDEFFATLFAFE